MKINLLNNILVGFLTVLVSASCNMIKNIEEGKVVKVLHEKKLLDSIKEYELDIQWLRARGNALITINDEAPQELDLNIRSKADSLIWLNISKFKKRMFRGEFKKDSVKMVIEYPEKLFFKGSIDSIESDLNLSIPYALIEDLLMGRSYLKHLEDKFILQVKNNEYHLLSHRKRKTKRIANNKTKKLANYFFQWWIDPFTYKCKRINIIFPSSNSEINITYKNWEKINNQYFPMGIELIISNIELTYNLLIDYKNIKFDLPQKFPFKVIDNNYQSIKFND
ncbi:MAG: hypothetical protein CL841_07845 [Crocinitomicaceae bacterium]|nr:hypothetical protein [Crocinitomicaceae bacterium]